MRPPPIVRWTGSYGLVQADRPRTSPIAAPQGMIRAFLISVFFNVLLDWPFGVFRRHGHKEPTLGMAHSMPTFRRLAHRDAATVCHFWYQNVLCARLNRYRLGIENKCAGGNLKMRILGFAVAGMLALTAPISAQAVPLGSSMEQLRTILASGIVQVWGGCGWGWHPVPGHWSRWRGGWVPPHCAPNHYNGGWGPYGSSGGPYEGWRGPDGGGQSPYGGWQHYGGGS
jgi:hypothetical protein